MDARNKFTPGPWAAYGRVDGRISIKAGEACLIAVVAKQPAAWEANAALIAAAPEMLDALIRMREMYIYANAQSAFAGMGGDRYISPGKCDEILCKILGLDYMSCSKTDLDKAITKATGGAE